ncbi:DNA-processing protein DprA [Acanthopleuribacter pedis]|uniref:DNA-protecting protein DprA n=1 Tax=Acanthopleuribacter pedis TaxID=442870 RepID=A0A8J7U5W9_9BACT|nr:DNA-processing protein DprA [Acanthopleuribacter pedis]MBO1322157.1 DNA-protecting protein DprA [Acanthopleuribacter pedis]
MNTNVLTEDTKAILLLCGVFGNDRTYKPLSLTEYGKLVRWLVDAKMRPRHLLRAESFSQAGVGAGINPERLKGLLSRGVLLGFALEAWQRDGIWVISRGDVQYPARFKKRLKHKAPPLLFGIGNPGLLVGGGLGIVGSRNVDGEGDLFARHIAGLGASNGMPVVSGGARGVDQSAMNAALEAGGVSIGVLADSLLKRSLERANRRALAEGRLLLLSPYHPQARFSVGGAMGRNKLIYALADFGVVVSADYQKGGTWAGAEEELKRENPVPVFVRVGDRMPEGNRRLVDLGAIPWPKSPAPGRLAHQLGDLSARHQQPRPEKNRGLFDAVALD